MPTIAGNAGVAAAVVTFVGFSTSTAVQVTCDGSGNFTSPTLTADTYYIQPMLAGNTFAPTISKQVLSASNITGVNFTATAYTPTKIWTKYGAINLLTPSSANGSSLGGTQPTGPCVLLDSNPQVLTGLATVFKIWYMDGANIRYAESPDGLNWTIRAGNLFTGASWVTIFKNPANSTYYLYAKVGALTTISSYTAPDGVTFTLQNSAALAAGAAGTWDAGGVYQLTVADIISGTWHALYTGLSGSLTSSSQVQCLGHATSSDGLTWTADVANNPVIFNGAAIDVHKRSGIYYGWMNTCDLYLSAGAGFIYTFPNEVYRMQSPDLINWSGEVMSLPRTFLGEGSNTVDGQTGNQCLVEVQGNTYMFYMGTNSGSGTGHTATNFQTLLATAQMNIATLAATNEGVLRSPQLSIDSCQRANESPLSQGGAWASVPGAPTFTMPQLQSNLITPTSIATWAMARRVDQTYPDDQYVEIVLSANHGTSTFQIVVPLRLTSNGTSNYNDYQFTIDFTLGSSDTLTNVGKVVAGTFTQLTSATAVTYLAGDVIRFQAVRAGTPTTTLKVFQNGVIISALTVTDTTPALQSGAPGIQMYNDLATADTAISGWAAGSAAAIALPGPNSSGDLGPGYDFKFRL